VGFRWEDDHDAWGEALVHSATTGIDGSPERVVTMARTELDELADTNWVGTGELWLDPHGDTAHRYECAMAHATSSATGPCRRV